MKLIVGLGNPGAAYRDTRHNMGFRVLDSLAEKLNTSFDREKYRALVALGMWEGEKLLLLKPLTFMNNSGDSVARAARNSIDDPADVLVVYDEAELTLGSLRMRAQGSAGTHNGMKSVVERLGTRDFARLRVGVGRDGSQGDLTDHVLGKFKPDERKLVDEVVEESTRAVLRFIDSGAAAAMSEFNKTARKD